MGEVYRARDTKLGREVAIKVLLDDVSADAERQARFDREARVLASLNHPNIVTIHAIEELEGRLYLVMELVEGRTLRECMAEGPLKPSPALELTGQIASGLSRAHEAGIVHRDLKPENVMVTDDGLVKILDFGLAKLVHPPATPDDDALTTDRNLTRPGDVIGTFAYMSPEQVAGRPVDARSDQFVLGTVLYEMTTGQHPFRRRTQIETLSAIVEAQAMPLSQLRPDLPGALSAVVERTLSKEPELRYPDLRALKAALETDGDGLPAFPSFLNAPASNADAPTSVVVGRERELHFMSTALDAATTRGVRPIFVVGEAGSGKTTLIHEFVRRAQETHPTLVVASGHCDAQTGIGDPYLPFRDVLALLCGEVETRCAVGAISHHQAQRLWELFPETLDALVSTGRDLIDTFVSADVLLSRSVHFPSSSPSRARLERLATATPGAAVQQSAVLEQYTRLLLELARKRPLLVVIEDLHWADAGTVSLLFHLCRRLEGSPVLVVGSYRPSLLNVGGEVHPLQSVVHALRAQLGEVHVLLGSEGGGRAFVDAVIDASPNRLGREFRDALFRHTLGQPLFTVELLRELRDREVVNQDTEGREFVTGAIDWDALPARVEAVIAERLARVPERLTRFLKLASIEGGEFTAEVIASAEGADEREVVRALSEELDIRHQLVRAVGIRRSGGQRLSRYRFRHILFQKYVYQQIDDVERTYLHEEVGVRLESLLGDGASEAAVQLARHFDEAGLAEKAVGYLQRLANAPYGSPPTSRRSSTSPGRWRSWTSCRTRMRERHGSSSSNSASQRRSRPPAASASPSASAPTRGRRT